MRASRRIEVLRFEVAGSRFALRLGDVHEVLRAVAPAALADAPPGVRGVIDVRGTLVPLYDLRPRLGLAPARVRPSDVLIVVGAAPRLCAVLADRVEGIEQVGEEAFTDPALRFATTDLLAGAVMLHDGVRVVYDLEAFLTAAEQAQLAAALAQHAP